MAGRGGAKAGYRWYGSAAIEPAAIQTGHQAATLARVQAASGEVVLVVQDTTAVSVNHRMTDAGYLSVVNQPGVWLHTTLALSVRREPYGVLAQEQGVRALADFPQGESRGARATAEKESQKWLTSLQAAAALQRVPPTKTVVSVGDREADVYDLFVAGTAPASNCWCGPPKTGASPKPTPKRRPCNDCGEPWLRKWWRAKARWKSRPA